MTARNSLRDALRELGEGQGTLVHPTYRHLERRARLAGLTFLQWGQLAACVLAAWLLSRALPLPGPYDVSVAVTVAGIPAAAALALADGELQIAAIARGLRGWHAARGLYLPGETHEGGNARGYELRLAEARLTGEVAGPHHQADELDGS